MIRPACYESDLTAAVLAAGPVRGWTPTLDANSGDLIFATPCPSEDHGTAIVATPFFGDDEAGLHLIEQTVDGVVLRERTFPATFAGDLNADVGAVREAVDAYADPFSD